MSVPNLSRIHHQHDVGNFIKQSWARKLFVHLLFTNERPVVEGEPEAITHHKMCLTFGEAAIMQ